MAAQGGLLASAEGFQHRVESPWVCQEGFFITLTGEAGSSDPGLNREQVWPLEDRGVLIHQT